MARDKDRAKTNEGGAKGRFSRSNRIKRLGRQEQGAASVSFYPLKQSRLPGVPLGVWQFLCVCLTVLGSAYCFASGFHLPQTPWWVPVGIGALGALSVLSVTLRPLRHVGPLCYLVLLGGAVWYFWPELTEGFVITVNHMVWRINEYLNWSLYDYLVHAPAWDYARLSGLFLLCCAALICLLSAWLAAAGRPLLLALLHLPFVLAVLYFNLTPDTWAVFCRLAGLLLDGGLAQRAPFVSQEPARARRGNKERQHSGYARRGSAQTGALVLVAGLICSALAFGLQPASRYQRPQQLDELARQINDGADALLQGDFTFWQTRGGVSEGDLGRTGYLRFQNETALRLHLGEGEQWMEPLYLRGYAGSVYTGSSWEDLPQEQYLAYAQDAPQTFAPLNQEAVCAQLSQPGVEQYQRETPYLSVMWSVEQGRLDIENVGAWRKYLYTPYGLSSTPGSEEMANARFVQDAYIQADAMFGVDRYQLTFWKGTERLSEQASLTAENALTGERFFNLNEGQGLLFRQQEKAYRLFAYQTYTQLPQQTIQWAREYLQQHAVDWIGPTDGRVPTRSAVYAVHELLAADDFQYTASPGPVPQGEDFARYFLETSKRGYCVHYATAAAVLLRAMGVPTRHVEGVVVTYNDLEPFYSEGNTVIDIPDSNAHAWVEIYIDGYGWAPVEFTPGYDGFYTNPPPEDAPPQSEPAESQESAAVSSQPEEEPESSRQLAQEETSSLRQSQAPATSSQPEVQQAQSYQFPWGVLAALGAVVLVGFALWLRRRVVWRRRLARWTGPDANAAVLDIYRYLLRLLELQGRLPQEEQTPQELARLVEGQGGKSCLFGDPGLFTQLTELAQQARFGRTPVPRRQAEEMAAFAQRARLVTERKLTAGKRLLARYGKALL